MKYIRTKDGIVNVADFIDKKENYSIRAIKGTREEKERFVYFAIGGINQADTIEELCDEFRVAGYTTIPKRCDIGIKKLFDSQNKYLTIELDSYGQRHGYDLMTFLKTKPKCCIYGAIWTDKGLIYVAKMNEKGCLELI